MLYGVIASLSAILLLNNEKNDKRKEHAHIICQLHGGDVFDCRMERKVKAIL